MSAIAYACLIPNLCINTADKVDSLRTSIGKLKHNITLQKTRCNYYKVTLSTVISDQTKKTNFEAKTKPMQNFIGH